MPPEKGVSTLDFTLGAGVASLGLDVSQDLVNVIFVVAFLGAPLVALLVAKLVARRHQRMAEQGEEQGDKVEVFSGELLDELSETVSPEVLSSRFAGYPCARTFALSVLSLVRAGRLSMTPTATPEEGAWRFAPLEKGLIVKSGVAGATVRLCLPEGSADDTAGGAIAALVRKQERAHELLDDFCQLCADRERAAGYVRTKGGMSGLTVALVIIYVIAGCLCTSIVTLPGLASIATVLGGLVLLTWAQGELSDEGVSVSDEGRDLVARGEAHRRWILARHGAGEALPGSSGRVDRTLRMALALGIDAGVVLDLARASGDAGIEWFLSSPAEGIPSPLDALADLYEAARYARRRWTED